jgi:choline dehydrogenase
MANRLSEMDNKKILLLEEGRVDDHLFISIPAAGIKMFGSDYVFNYNSEPQKYKDNQKIYLPQGKVLGGSSSINAMAYLRGSAYDYDEWEKLGNKGWNYKECLKYFKKSENQQRNKNEIDNEYHGFEGPWKIDDVRQPHELTKLVIKGFNEEHGLPIVNDFNASEFQEESVGLIQVNISKGQRHSISDAYLDRKVLKRNNLFVRTEVKVSRVLIDEKSKTAVGVEIIKKKGSFESIERIWAKNEVILSSGVFNSPKILMLSGIGNGNVLKDKGIKIIVDNPEVGQNLQDHPYVGLVRLLKNPISLDMLNHFPQNFFSLLRWNFFRDNELAKCAEMTGYIRSNVAKKNNEAAPDLQIGFIKSIFINHGKNIHAGKYGYALGPILLNPKSKGSVTIKSKNVNDDPIIDLNIYQDQEDFERIIDGTKIMKNIIEGKTLTWHIKS